MHWLSLAQRTVAPSLIPPAYLRIELPIVSALFSGCAGKGGQPWLTEVAMQYMAAKTAHISGVLASRLYRYALCFAQTMRVPLSSACRKSATFIAEMMQYHCGHGGKSVH